MNTISSSVYKGKQVRHMDIDGDPWWVLKDVCCILGLSSTKWTANRLDEDEVSLTHLVDARGCKQRTYIINESGLYSVLLRSDKPEAKPFKRWVTHEVLPSIRKTGQYAMHQAAGQRSAVKVATKLVDFECWPSIAEVAKASEIFKTEVEKRIADTKLPQGSTFYMSEATLLRCALSEVWRQGKIWYKHHPNVAEIGEASPITPVQKVIGKHFQNVLTVR